jgi:hypothetical protein
VTEKVLLLLLLLQVGAMDTIHPPMRTIANQGNASKFSVSFVL